MWVSNAHGQKDDHDNDDIGQIVNQSETSAKTKHTNQERINSIQNQN